MLLGREPLHGASDPGLLQILSGQREPDEHRPRAVNVVRAPSPPKTTVGPLLALEIIDTTTNRGPIALTRRAASGQHAQACEHTTGDVLRRRVEHGAMIGEGNTVEVIRRVVRV